MLINKRVKMILKMTCKIICLYVIGIEDALRIGYHEYNYITKNEIQQLPVDPLINHSMQKTGSYINPWVVPSVTQLVSGLEFCYLNKHFFFNFKCPQD